VPKVEYKVTTDTVLVFIQGFGRYVILEELGSPLNIHTGKANLQKKMPEET
jgi:hypothetical protein